MLRFEIGPQSVEHENVGVYRLHRQKATQATATAPANDQIQTRYIGRSQAALLEPSEVPLPIVVDKKIHFDSLALADPERRQLDRKLRGPLVAQYQQRGAPATDLLRKDDTCGTEQLGLRRGSARIILCEPKDRNFPNAACLACFEECHPWCDAARVSLLPCEAMFYRPAPVAVRNEADMPGQTTLAMRLSSLEQGYRLCTHVSASSAMYPSSRILSILSGNAHRDQRNRAIHFLGNIDGDRYRSSLRVAQPCSPQQGQSVPIKKCRSQYALCFSLDGPLQLTHQPIKFMMGGRNRLVGAVPRLSIRSVVSSVGVIA